MRADTKELAGEVIQAVKNYVNDVLAPILARIVAAESRLLALPKPDKGEKGDRGDAGKDGRDGADGKDGIPGKDGSNGIDGKDGAPGLNGKDGAPGGDGNDGARGKDGRDGADADMVKVEQWIAAAVRQIPEPKNGERGEKGGDGKDGKDGIDGKDGKPGERGEPGKVGADGRDGKDGRDAKDGRDGKDGDPGRDALMIVPLDGIDHVKSYPRGTWACYRGGTFCAVRATDPFPETIGSATLAIAGWTCAMDGVWDEIEEHFEDGRRIEKVTIWASGKVRKVSRIGRSVIYRGIYKPDVEYTKGDQVTWGGSQWHCTADKTQERPGGGSPDWVLAVKHGEPGKAARVESGDRPASVVKLK